MSEPLNSPRPESVAAKTVRKALDEYDAMLKCYRGLLAAYRTGNHRNVDSLLTKLETLDEKEARATIEAQFTALRSLRPTNVL